MQRTSISLKNKLARILWLVVYQMLFRPSPASCHFWRRGLLRMFGAKIEAGAHPYPGCKIWAPWNLIMREHSCLANDVDCYNIGLVVLGANSIVSQSSYLCTASHDHRSAAFELTMAPIRIGTSAWVAARAFVGPGVTVGEGAVVGATASVFKDVPSWTVVGGNPAKVIGTRSARTCAVERAEQCDMPAAPDGRWTNT